jgi:hypothetical protein
MVAVRGLLQASQQFDWSPELYARVIQLGAFLLYEPPGILNVDQQQQMHGDQTTQHKQEEETVVGADEQQHRIMYLADGGKVVAAVEESLQFTIAAQGKARGVGREGIPEAEEADGASLQDAGVTAGSAITDRHGILRAVGRQVVLQRVAELGGLNVLVQHICTAPSAAAQRSLMVPLVEALIPAGEAFLAGEAKTIREGFAKGCIMHSKACESHVGKRLHLRMIRRCDKQQ